jgi:hypothetical protein
LFCTALFSVSRVDSVIAYATSTIHPLWIFAVMETEPNFRSAALVKLKSFHALLQAMIFLEGSA